MNIDTHIVFYLIAGAGAAMTQVLMDTQSQIPMVGASGAIAGLLGSYIIHWVLIVVEFFHYSSLPLYLTY